MKILIAICAITILIGLTSSPARAQEAPNQILLSPASFDVSIDPGTSQKLSFKLINATQFDREFVTNIRVLSVSGNEVGETSESQKFLDYMQINEMIPSVVLPANSSKDIEFDFKLDPATPPGSLVLGFFFQDKTSSKVNQAIGEIGGVVFLTVTGDLKYSAAVELSTSTPISLSVAELTATILNQGNAILAPQGVLNINPVLGIGTYSVDFNNERLRVFPGSSRNFELNQTQPTLLGVFDAELVTAYSPRNKVASATTRIIIIPWHILAGSVIAALTILYLYRHYRAKQ